jgi:hypothetical protein
MIRHDHLADYDEIVPLPHLFQYRKEEIAPSSTAEPGLAGIAAAGNKVGMVRPVIALRMAAHLRRIVIHPRQACDGCTLRLDPTFAKTAKVGHPPPPMHSGALGTIPIH